MSHWLQKSAAILPWLELVILAAAAPFLLFPTARPRWTAVMLALLAAILPATVDHAARTLAFDAFQRRALAIGAHDPGGGLGFGAARPDLAEAHRADPGSRGLPCHRILGS